LKLGVIGEPCIDYIHRGRISLEKQFGGILYSVISLAVISGKTSDVYPIMNLGEDEFEAVTAFFRKFANIRTDYISKSGHKTRVVNLFYKGDRAALSSAKKTAYDREESSTRPAPAVEFKQVKEALEILDGILINMVSGKDISLETLKKIRKIFPGYIHMDLHNLVMKALPGGSRIQTPVKNWLEWCSICDTLQMNESEISVLTNNTLSEHEIASEILKKSKVKCIVVTRGKDGASIYMKAGKEKEIDKASVNALDVVKFAESTGCGDVFASAFFFNSLNNNLSDFKQSLEYANKLAGLNVSIKGVEQLKCLNDRI
jgi:sugar/nucleoside kinase (ribokinase family)